MKNLFVMSLLSGAAALLTGCAGTLNTAENSDFGCGLPAGQTCKTPTAVYNSTHSASAVTEYDTPVGSAANVAIQAGDSSKTPSMMIPGGHIHSTIKGPRPVREPAQIVRIWIAPWVDSNDTLHLAQYQFAEVKPRTWTVGLEETKGGGYVIPHMALSGIAKVAGQEEAPKTEAASKKPAENSGMTSEALDAINNATRGATSQISAPR